MKNIVFLCCVFIIMISHAFSDYSFELRTRLDCVNSFYTKFIQKITDSTGAVVQENYGELWVQHPNSFNYHIISPEESYLISNGRILWFYDLSLNQVIVRWLKDVFDNIFLTLLINGPDKLNWHEYYVAKDKDTFSLIPKNNQNSVLKEIRIKITKLGKIERFSILNRENQHINYQLTHYDNVSSFDIDRFNFSLPNGVMVDEQREK